MASVIAEIHPDDLARSRAAMVAHLRGTSDAYDMMQRVRHRSGEWIWVQASGLAVRDGEGRVLRFFGTVGDVSERKTAEVRRAARAQRIRDAGGPKIGQGSWWAQLVPLVYTPLGAQLS